MQSAGALHVAYIIVILSAHTSILNRGRPTTVLQGWYLPEGASFTDSSEDTAIQQFPAPIWSSKSSIHLPSLWAGGAASGTATQNVQIGVAGRMTGSTHISSAASAQKLFFLTSVGKSNSCHSLSFLFGICQRDTLMSEDKLTGSAALVNRAT